MSLLGGWSVGLGIIPGCVVKVVVLVFGGQLL